MKSTVIKTLKHKRPWVECAAFSSDEEFLATCCGEHVYLWNVKDVAKLIFILEHVEYVWAISFFPGDEQLLTGCSDGTIHVWDLASGKLTLSFRAHEKCVFGCTIAPRHKLICTSSRDGVIKLFHFTNDPEVQIEYICNLDGHINSVEHVIFSSSEENLATCSKDRSIRLWAINMKSLKETNCPRILTGHRNWVLSCSFSPDDTLLCSSSADKSVRLWQVESGNMLFSFRGHSSIVWSCTFLKLGERLLIASCSSDKSLRFWDAVSGRTVRCRRFFGGVKDGTGQLFCVTSGRHSNQMAVTSYHGNVYIIRVEDSPVDATAPSQS